MIDRKELEKIREDGFARAQAWLDGKEEREKRERLRDTFAAAALTGLLARSGIHYTGTPDDNVREMWRWADAMLRERERHHIPDAGKMVENPTNHDAVPEARAKPSSTGHAATLDTAGVAGLQREIVGTGNTNGPETRVVCESGLSVYVPVNPAARHTPANKGDGGLPPDVPQPDNGLATSGRGHNTQEPVAWAILHKDHQYVSLLREHAQAHNVYTDAEIVPLYRSPTLTDEEREAIRLALRMAGDPSPITAPQVFQYAATLRSLLERMK